MMNYYLLQRFFVALCLVTALATAGRAADFIEIPGPWSLVQLSKDGLSVVGKLFSLNGPVPPSRWTRDGGLEELWDLPVNPITGVPDAPQAISANSSVITGTVSTGFEKWRPYIWTSGQTNVFDATFYDFHVVGLTADGTAMFGFGYQGPGTPLLAYRWTTDTGLKQLDITLGEPNGGDLGKISADGSVLAGSVTTKVTNTFYNEPFRWTEQTGMVKLFTDEERKKFGTTTITGISGDGRVIVGTSASGGIRWTAESGSQLIPSLPGFSQAAPTGISFDGSVIVGNTLSRDGIREPFIWDPVHGTRNLREVLVNDYDLGESLDGLRLINAQGISDDGRAILLRGGTPASRFFMAVLDAPEAVPLSWNLDADGNWSLASNWRGGVPSDNADVVFGRLTTATRTINADMPATLGSIEFDSPHAYMVVGMGALTMDSKAALARIDVVAGSHVIDAPLNLADDAVFDIDAGSRLSVSALNADAKTLTKEGTGALNVNPLHAAGLSINGGTVAIMPNGTAGATSVVGMLAIAGGSTPTAKFDLDNSAVIIDYTATSPADMARQQIIAGRGGPGLGQTWNGNGITSSAAAAANATEPESRSVGYAENATLPLGPYTTFRGQSVGETSLLIAYTRTGDANLDGLVNDEDVTIVGAAYAPGVANAHWSLGDFDYNGFVDDDDVTLLGAFYDATAAPLIAPPLAPSTAPAISEPATWALFAAAILMAVFVRRQAG